MANKKFSEFELKTTTSNVSHIVGYNGAENVRITPANFLDTTGGPYLPLAGGIMVGNTIHNDNVKSIYGTASDGLEIFHDSVASYIVDTGTGTLNVRGSTQVNIGGANGTIGFQTVEGANSSMRHNNVTKLSTSSTGISVDGQANITSDDTTFISQLLDNTNTTDSGTESTEIKFRLYRSYVPGLNDAGNIVLGKEEAWDGAEDRKSYMAFGTRNGSAGVSEKLRISSAGNVGIGTSTFTNFATAKQLLVKGDASNTNSIIQVISNDSNSSLAMYSGASTTDNPLLVFQNDLRFGSATNAGLGSFSEKMRLDASGNLGIGTSVIPSYWSGYVALQIGADNSIFGNSATSAGSALFIGQNIYNDGNVNRYTSTDEAGLIDLRNGVFKYLNAPSGSIGTEATLTERLIIDNTGNVGIGTSTPAYKTSIKQEGDFNGSQVLLDLSLRDTVGGSYNAGTAAGISFSSSHWSQSTTEKIMGSIFGANSDGGSGTNGYLSFRTRLSDTVTEKIRITSTGNLGIGVTAPYQKTVTNGHLAFTTGTAGTDFVGDVRRNGIGWQASNNGGNLSAFINSSTVGAWGGDLNFFTRGSGSGNLIQGMKVSSTGQLFLFSQLSGAGNATLKYTTGTGAVTFDTSSRLVKDEIETIPYGLDTVLKLSPKRYIRNDSNNKLEIGFIADEVQKVVPELVGIMEKKLFTKNEEDTEMIAGSVEYEKMTAILVKAIQELTAKVEKLELNK